MSVVLPSIAALLAASMGLANVPTSQNTWTLDRDGHDLIAKGKQSKGGGHHNSGHGSRGRTGFNHSSPSFDRGDKKPIGGWRDGHVGANEWSRHSGSRVEGRHDGHRNHGNSRDDWQRAGDRWDRRVDRTVRHLDKDWERVGDRWDRRLDHAGDRLDHRLDRIDHRIDRRLDHWDSWHGRWPGWARRGWGLARPWNYGWYEHSNNNPPWGWWGARAAAWGVGTLATASIINNAVDRAIDDQDTTIVVPDSNYRLIYGSVAPSNDQSLSFSAVNADQDVAFTADCRSGDLNGQAPASVAEAELLNAACQIAFGDS